MFQSKRVALTMLVVLFLTAPALADPAEEHPAVQAWSEAWSAGAGTVESFLTEDVQYRGPFFDFKGRHHYQDIVDLAQRLYRGADCTVDEVFLNGDRGVLSWTISATDVASGNAVKIHGVSILQFKGDKIAGERRIFDTAELARQVGGSVTFPGSDGGGGGDGAE